MIRERTPRSAWRDVLIIAAAWALVCLPRLGSGGFTDTEGHRVIPGWELADAVRAPDVAPDPFVPRMFGRAYMRKPQGMTWAIALSGWMCGESELSARLVSAVSLLVLAVGSWWFASSWFGERRALAGGLAVLLMPTFWPIARAAEIEMLMIAGAGLGALGIMDLLTRAHEQGRGRDWLSATVAAVGIVVAVLAKGPAALPVFGGAVLGPIVVARSVRPLLRAPLLATLGGAGAALGVLAIVTARRVGALGETPITQSPGEFLWSSGLATLVIPFAAFAMGLPASLALLFPWGPDAAREPQPVDAWPDGARERARALAWSFLLGSVIFVVAGVSNPRYALPLLVFVPGLVAYVTAGLDSGFLAKRRAIARVMSLGRARVWVPVLLVGALVWSFGVEPGRRATSGRDAGVRLAELMPEGERVILLANDLVEARPETLLYAKRAAGERGCELDTRWTPLDGEALARAAGAGVPVVVVARDDADSDEAARVMALAPTDAWRELGRGTVHKYAFIAYAWRPGAEPR